MSKPELTPEIFAELKRLMAAATPGPWVYDTYNTLVGRDGNVVCTIPDHEDGDGDYNVSATSALLIELLYSIVPPLVKLAEEHAAVVIGSCAALSALEEKRRNDK